MIDTKHFRGHPIYVDGLGDHRYRKNDKLVEFHYPDHPCKVCGLTAPQGEHDPCIKSLGGNVTDACCGHGDEATAYVQYSDKPTVYGKEAIEAQQQLKESDENRNG